MADHTCDHPNEKVPIQRHNWFVAWGKTTAINCRLTALISKVDIPVALPLPVEMIWPGPNWVLKIGAIEPPPKGAEADKEGADKPPDRYLLRLYRATRDGLPVEPPLGTFYFKVDPNHKVTPQIVSPVQGADCDVDLFISYGEIESPHRVTDGKLYDITTADEVTAEAEVLRDGQGPGDDGAWVVRFTNVDEGYIGEDADMKIFSTDQPESRRIHLVDN